MLSAEDAVGVLAAVSQHPDLDNQWCYDASGESVGGLANCSDTELSAETISNVTRYSVDMSETSHVMVGRDTCVSSHASTSRTYRQPNLTGYYDKLSSDFNKLMMSLVPDKGHYSW